MHVHHVIVVPNPSPYYVENLCDDVKIEGRIIAVGRLFEQKRFDRLIDAFALISSKYSTWNLSIFGDGPLREMLKKQIERKGLAKRVSLNKPTHDILHEYQLSQFLVLSSDFEGFGLVITEAMACGIPVVAADCPYGPSEIIEDGVTGLLSKMEVKDLASKMEWMITHPDERKQMGKNAHLAAAKYRKEVIIPEWERAYMSVIKK